MVTLRHFPRTLFVAATLARPGWALAETEAPKSPQTASSAPTRTPAEATANTQEEAPPAAAVTEAAARNADPSATAPDGASMPHVHHAPRTAHTRGEPLSMRADVKHPERIKRLLLVYRTTSGATPRELEFRRASDAPYLVEVPADQVELGWFEYCIELEMLDQTRRDGFAARDRMHRVQIAEPLVDIRERASFERLGKRRSVFSATSEYVDFGRSDASVEVMQADGTTSLERLRVDDRYLRVEAGYTYRPLRAITEFSLRVGIVRGQSPVPTGELAPGQEESERFDVGLNYGLATARLRLHDMLHVEGEFLTSVTEVGFSIGAGGAAILGDPHGTRLTLGYEAIQVFGMRFYSALSTVVHERVVLTPIMEVTDMPHADKFGVRLLGEVSVDVGGGVQLSGRGGYQARVFTEGGPSVGLGAGYAF